MLPKLEKNHVSPSDYRPVGLLNFRDKILSKTVRKYWIFNFGSSELLGGGKYDITSGYSKIGMLLRSTASEVTRL
jgi:hypothetical protein